MQLADDLDDSRFDSETLTDWQDQARMVIDIPGLRGTHAQLLVGAQVHVELLPGDGDLRHVGATHQDA